MHWLALALVVSQQMLDPLCLPIGRSGEITARAGDVIDLRTGRPADPDAIAAAADGTQYLFVGESHDQPDHHKFQAQVIEALAKRGRNVIVGFEMFTRPVQSSLNPWTMGWWDEDQFIAESDWKNQWGFDFAIYRPIFEATKRLRLPMVALNVPRAWVRAVGKEGYAGLTAEQRSELPAEFDVNNQNHRAIVAALMGGHPPMGDRGENMYAAQVLWDTGMADTAIKYMSQAARTPNTVMVVIAGSGHVMYGQGINWRVYNRTHDRGITVVMAEAKDPIQVSRGLADFVYVAPELNRDKGQ